MGYLANILNYTIVIWTTSHTTLL